MMETRTAQRSDQRSGSRHGLPGGTGEDQPGSEDGRSMEDTKGWEERKSTEQEFRVWPQDRRQDSCDGTTYHAWGHQWMT